MSFQRLEVNSLFPRKKCDDVYSLHLIFDTKFNDWTGNFYILNFFTARILIVSNSDRNSYIRIRTTQAPQSAIYHYIVTVLSLQNERMCIIKFNLNRNIQISLISLKKETLNTNAQTCPLNFVYHSACIMNRNKNNKNTETSSNIFMLYTMSFNASNLCYYL